MTKFYRLPMRDDTIIDELRLLEESSRLLRQCMHLHAKADLSKLDREGYEQYMEMTLQDIYDLKFSPLRVFVLSQIVRDLKILKVVLWEAIPTETHPAVFHMPAIDKEFASAPTEPTLIAIR